MFRQHVVSKGRLLLRGSTVSGRGGGEGGSSVFRSTNNSSGTFSAKHIVTTTQGSICAEPVKVKFGIFKALAAAIPGILFGATLAKNGAAWLEENEIFIPDDDDDD